MKLFNFKSLKGNKDTLSAGLRPEETSVNVSKLQFIHLAKFLPQLLVLLLSMTLMNTVYATTLSCSDVAGGGTHSGNVLVENGESCRLDVPGTVIEGNFDANGAHGVWLENITIMGNVTIQHSTGLINLKGGTPDLNEQGEGILVGGTIIHGTLTVRLNKSNLAILVGQPHDFDGFPGSGITVHGNVDVVNNTAPFDISVSTNVIHGSVSIIGNTANPDAFATGFAFAGVVAKCNAIDGNVEMSGNTSDVVVESLSDCTLFPPEERLKGFIKGHTLIKGNKSGFAFDIGLFDSDGNVAVENNSAALTFSSGFLNLSGGEIEGNLSCNQNNNPTPADIFGDGAPIVNGNRDCEILPYVPPPEE